MFSKKQLTKICLFLSLTNVCFAQKVDLDPWRFTTNFRHFPNKLLDKTYNTYDVVVSVPGNVRNNYSEETIKEKVRIEGFRQLDKRGHLTVFLNTSDVFISETKVTERVEVQKDKDGKETGRIYHYKPIVNYTFEASADVKTYKGDRVGGVMMSPRSKIYLWEGTESTSSKEANDYINNNRSALRNQFTRDRVEEATRILSNNLSDEYGFSNHISYQQVYLLDNKKHPEYEGHQKVVSYVKEVLGKEMQGNAPIDDIKARFEPLRTYLEESVKKYNKSDKSDTKMRYAAYYALAKIAYWLDEPDDCIKYAEALVANGFDEKDGKNMIEEANALKAIFAKHGAKSRHFSIDTSVFEGPK